MVKVYLMEIARILRKTQAMALEIKKSRLLKTTLVPLVIVQVEFSLVAGFWVGLRNGMLCGLFNTLQITGLILKA